MVAVSWFCRKPHRGGWTRPSAASSLFRRRPAVSAMAATTPKNGGHHLDAAHRRRHDQGRRDRAHLGGFRLLHRPWAWGPVRRLAHRRQTMGNRITKLNQARASAPTAAARSPCSLPPGWGFPCPPPIPSPAPSPASGSTRICRRVRWGVAGASSGAWLLTIPCRQRGDRGCFVVPRPPSFFSAGT